MFLFSLCACLDTRVPSYTISLLLYYHYYNHLSLLIITLLALPFPLVVPIRRLNKFICLSWLSYRHLSAVVLIRVAYVPITFATWATPIAVTLLQVLLLLRLFAEIVGRSSPASVILEGQRFWQMRHSLHLSPSSSSMAYLVVAIVVVTTSIIAFCQLWTRHLACQALVLNEGWRQAICCP